MTTYDVHAHCVPQNVLDELQREPVKYGTEVIVTDNGSAIQWATGATTRPVSQGLIDTAARIESMDKAGIDVQFISSWIDLTGYGLPDAPARRYARMFNESLAAMAADHPGRFLPLCNVPLQDPEGAAAELRRAVVDEGFVGAEIATTVEEVDLDDPALDAFWGAAAELQCPVLIHPSFKVLDGRDVSRFLLENLVGRAAESTIAVAYMLFSGVMERFPDLPLIIVHGGGFIPWQAARWDHGFAAAPGKTATHISRPPREQLRNVYFDTVLFDPKVIGYLVDWAGADRVVLGSDYPFPMGDLSPIATLDGAGLSDHDRQLIVSGNVERVLAGIRR